MAVRVGRFPLYCHHNNWQELEQAHFERLAVVLILPDLLQEREIRKSLGEMDNRPYLQGGYSALNEIDDRGGWNWKVTREVLENVDDGFETLQSARSCIQRARSRGHCDGVWLGCTNRPDCNLEGSFPACLIDESYFGRKNGISPQR